jgi:3-oxoacyl-[acyl-carrier protein] reductase
MDLQLADKTAFITGASGGIGRALAEALAAEGCRLALHAHAHADALERWRAAQPWAERAIAVTADVRDPQAMSAAVDEAVARLGRIDVCVANAGVWPVADERLDELDPARAVDTIAVNLLGAMWTARGFLRALAQAGPRDDGHGACLIFIGSTAGRFGERGHCDYAAAKAGLRGLTLSLKNEIAALDPYGRVNLVEPGWTVTHMARPALDQPGTIARVVRTMALRQLARAADVARTVVALASPALSRHVSGEVVTVAGGMEGRVLWEPADIDEAAIRARLDR